MVVPPIVVPMVVVGVLTVVIVPAVVVGIVGTVGVVVGTDLVEVVGAAVVVC